jgi:hypothetical protein
MIEELVAQIRGVNKWPETEATVASVDRVLAVGRSAARATVTFTYRPDEGEIQSGIFFVGDQSSLYNLDEGEAFPVRYGPARPERFYSSEYVIPFWWNFYAVLIGMFLLVFIYVFLKIR